MKTPTGIVEITSDEERELLRLPPKPELPKYSSQLINLANQFAQGTRPKVVGQMSELIKEFRKSGGKTFEDWKKWYLRKYPKAIDEATRKIWDMLGKFKEALEHLNEEDVRKWVEDLVLVKTYEGLMLQEAILKKVAEEVGAGYRLATPEEESKGIDGVIILKNREIPVSIKPKTYVMQERHLPEELKGYLIVYEKKKNKIVIDYSPVLTAL
ncbi:MjaI family restriction endonuclease [Thermococcus sp. SY098]|uniref:MjaI family restriction endonuclease n=1 Tax=Thermococcus sp. SY098 TaxID=3111325 RepID=UPI002D796EFF|nr:MjaI family restriction endonuclease [Thermococcus sp. SY098]WRS51996.1 MjaI family restriction endonuclease [Thermococcus sp. SY098]